MCSSTRLVSFFGAAGDAEAVRALFERLTTLNIMAVNKGLSAMAATATCCACWSDSAPTAISLRGLVGDAATFATALRACYGRNRRGLDARHFACFDGDMQRRLLEFVADKASSALANIFLCADQPYSEWSPSGKRLSCRK